MSATETLRAMLDECWVEHYDGTEMTLWLKDEHGYRASAHELHSGRLSVHIWCDTPEHAIEATLGRGECRNKATRPQIFWCDQCDCAAEGWVDVGGTLINGFRYCPNCGRKVRA